MFSVGILVADHLCDPISHVPAPGELILVERLPISIGGCASNVAIDLARLGVGVGVVGCVGRDAFGHYIVETLKGAGADTQDIRAIEGAETSASLIINVQGHDRRFIHAAGANTRLQADHIPRERMLASKVFYVGGYLLMTALEPEGLAALFREARPRGNDGARHRAARSRRSLEQAGPGAGRDGRLFAQPGRGQSDYRRRRPRAASRALLRRGSPHGRHNLRQCRQRAPFRRTAFASRGLPGRLCKINGFCIGGIF